MNFGCWITVAEGGALGNFLPLVVVLAVVVLMERAFTFTERLRRPPAVDAPTASFHLTASLGSGDVSDVYSAADGGRKRVVKIAKSSEAGHHLRREFQILRTLTENNPSSSHLRYLPRPVECDESDERTVSIYERGTGDYTASQLRERFPRGLDGRHVAWMFNRMLEVLGFVHEQGWIHGAVLPSHLLFDTESHGLELLGWTHAVRIGCPIEFAPSGFIDWYPEECRVREPATPSVDIFLAAKCAVFLAGGDPVRGAMPDSLPKLLRGFLKSCLLESVRMRPQDAWKLHAEFKGLLERVYGPPQFHPLHVGQTKGEDDGNHMLV